MRIKLKSLVEELLPSAMELVDLQTHREEKLHIQVFLDKVTGITMDDLTWFNHSLGKKLEETDIIQEPYILEVSSAGLERPLTAPEHFIRFQGRRVKLVLHKSVDNNRNLEGIIQSANDTEVHLSSNGRETAIQLANIKKANLVFDF